MRPADKEQGLFGLQQAGEGLHLFTEEIVRPSY
jgi:hypothetical protein